MGLGEEPGGPQPPLLWVVKASEDQSLCLRGECPSREGGQGGLRAARSLPMLSSGLTQIPWGSGEKQAPLHEPHSSADGSSSGHGERRGQEGAKRSPAVEHGVGGQCPESSGALRCCCPLRAVFWVLPTTEEAEGAWKRFFFFPFFVFISWWRGPLGHLCLAWLAVLPA